MVMVAHEGFDVVVEARNIAVSDNGTELTSSAILRWSQERRLHPGKAIWRAEA